MARPAKTPARPGNETDAATAAMIAIYPAATKAWLDVLSEGARFLTDRLQKDMETQKALLACTGPADLMRVQSEFVATAMKEYAEEATRMVRMMSEAVEDSAKDVRSGHRRSYDDVPL